MIMYSKHVQILKSMSKNSESSIKKYTLENKVKEFYEIFSLKT